ncbi:MAG: ATP-dependent Clp protease adaptor ClpS [Planctomycetota bacterium]|jgi:ATP-dependent Clp protease adaptor protein ClpS
MAQPNEHQPEAKPESGGGSIAVQTRPAPPKVERLPPWKVLLHNDDVNDMLYVAETIIELTTLNREDAVLRMLEAHETGVALLLVTNREHAELLAEQFASKHLTVTIEPEA